MLGLAPIVVLAADFALPAIALLFLPILAVHRGGSAGDREGAPGAPRRAHRPAEPRALPRPHRAGRQRRPPLRRDRGRHDDRPRSLQGDQRHARPPRRRPSPAGGRRAPARRRSRELRHGRPPRRRRVRRPAPDAAPATTTPAPSPSSCSRSCASRSSLEGMTLEIDASIGIACAPSTATDVETLDPARRHRHVLGQGRPAAATRSSSRARPPPPRRLALAGGLRSAIDDGEIVALLPAQGRPAHRPDHRRRGARALGSPAARPRRPDRVRADRRADRPDHAADLARARRRAAPGARVEGRRRWS